MVCMEDSLTCHNKKWMTSEFYFAALVSGVVHAPSLSQQWYIHSAEWRAPLVKFQTIINILSCFSECRDGQNTLAQSQWTRLPQLAFGRARPLYQLTPFPSIQRASVLWQMERKHFFHIIWVIAHCEERMIYTVRCDIKPTLLFFSQLQSVNIAFHCCVFFWNSAR